MPRPSLVPTSQPASWTRVSRALGAWVVVWVMVTGCGAPAPSRGLVVVDHEAQAAGVRVVVDDRVVEPGVAIEAPSHCHVDIVSSAGRVGVCVAAGDMLTVRGAAATQTTVAIGRDVRSDVVRVTGTRAAADQLAAHVGGSVTATGDGDWQLHAEGAWTTLAGLPTLEGLVDVMPVSTRDEIVSTSTTNGAGGNASSTASGSTPSSSNASTGANGATSSTTSASTTSSPWFQGVVGGTAASAANVGATGIGAGTSASWSGAYGGGLSSITSMLAPGRFASSFGSSWYRRPHRPTYSFFDDDDDYSNGENDTHSTGFRPRVVSAAAPVVRTFACGGRVSSRGSRDCTSVAPRSRIVDAPRVSEVRGARETVIRPVRISSRRS